MRPHATREEIDHVRERIAEFGYPRPFHRRRGARRHRRRRCGRRHRVPGIAGSDARRRTRHAHLRALQIRQQGVPQGAHRCQNRQCPKSAVKILSPWPAPARWRASARSWRPLKEWPPPARASSAGARSSPARRPTIFKAWRWRASSCLRKAREATGLAIITEVMSDRDVDLGRRVRRLHADRRAQHAKTSRS